LYNGPSVFKAPNTLLISSSIFWANVRRSDRLFLELLIKLKTHIYMFVYENTKIGMKLHKTAHYRSSNWRGLARW
jgi:hypothetical protein